MSKERDYDRIMALLKSIATDCDNPTEHAWRKCRHCLATQELDRPSIRKQLSEFIQTVEATTNVARHYRVTVERS